MKQQEEVFRNLDAQYEMARSQTHTQRGMGLGFTSSMRGENRLKAFTQPGGKVTEDTMMKGAGRTSTDTVKP